MDSITDDRLLDKSLKLAPYGTLLSEKYGKTMDAIIRALYKHLGDAYGVDLSTVLPDREITSATYRDDLIKIRQTLTNTGIGERTLMAFIERLTEVASLAHSVGYSFSICDPMEGGSFMPRNVTIGGAVLDLETFGDISQYAYRKMVSHEEIIAKDIETILVSVAYFHRLVSDTPYQGLREIVQCAYLDKLLGFVEDVKLLRRIILGLLRARTPSPLIR